MDGHEAEAAEHEKHGEFEHGRHHKNEVALFLGGTDEKGHDTEFTWGLDYKRRIAERWAVGVIFDYAGGELRNSILAPSVSFWPGFGELQLLAAAGIEFHDGRDDGGILKAAEEEHGSDTNHRYFLVRLGIAYDFHLPKGFGIVPQINLDLVNNKEVWVWGLALTYGF
jgi:hypothetical protein